MSNVVSRFSMWAFYGAVLVWHVSKDCAIFLSDRPEKLRQAPANSQTRPEAAPPSPPPITQWVRGSCQSILHNRTAVCLQVAGWEQSVGHPSEAWNGVLSLYVCALSITHLDREFAKSKFLNEKKYFNFTRSYVILAPEVCQEFAIKVYVFCFFINDNSWKFFSTKQVRNVMFPLFRDFRNGRQNTLSCTNGTEMIPFISTLVCTV
jgi:hypothetical protein